MCKSFTPAAFIYRVGDSGLCISKNTIPVQFIANCALLKNIENSLLQENKTVDDLQLISEINQRLQIESNEILADIYLQALDILRCGIRH